MPQGQIPIHAQIANHDTAISSNNARLERLRAARSVFVAQQAALRQPRRDYEQVRSKQLGNTLIRNIRARGQFEGRSATGWSSDYGSARQTIRERVGLAAELFDALTSQITLLDGIISGIEADNARRTTERGNLQNQLNSMGG